VFGTSPDFWLNGQLALDLYRTINDKEEIEEIEQIEPVLHLTSALPYDRRSGTRATCMQKCFEGEMDQDLASAISDEELEKGYRLICIGSPLSEVVLDTSLPQMPP